MSDSAKVDLFMTVDTGAWLRKAQGRPVAEKGAQFSLELAAWTAGGRLPSVPDRLRLIAGADPSEWASIWPQISDLWTATEDGKHIYLPEMLDAIERAKAARAAAVARGKAGRARQLGQDQPGTKPGLSQDEPGTPDSGLRTPEGEHRTPETNTEDPSRSPDGDRASAGYSDSFARFWAAWPKKVKKEDAWKVWRSKHCDQHLDAILAALAWQVKSGRWTADGGQYIPDPPKYLRGKEWEDDPSAYERKGNGARDPRVGHGRAESYHHTQTGVIPI